MALQYRAVFVAIAAVNFEQMIQFYRQLLDREPQSYQTHIYGEFHLTGLRLGIFKPKNSHQDEFADSRRSGMSLCLEVENLESAIAHLTEMGYPPPGEIAIASHGREIYAFDPAGNRLILHQSH